MKRRFSAPLIVALTGLAGFAAASRAGDATLPFWIEPLRPDFRPPISSRPAISADVDGVLAVAPGDSVDISYATRRTRGEVEIACVNCGQSVTFTRSGPNTIRVFALRPTADTVARAICFTVHGSDARERADECVRLTIGAARPRAYSVPLAIRQSEFVALHAIAMPTYDKSDQSAHPDFQRIAVPWSVHGCWMVFTPYADEQSEFENPSLASSPDCEHWTPAKGVKAPLVDKPSSGYNSDPDLLYDPARGCMGVMFRQVTTANTILLTKSCDGTSWSAPRLLFSVANHGAISPTVSVGPDGLNRVWYISAGTKGCGAQNNVVKMRTGSAESVPLDHLEFGSELPTDLAQPGWVIWHIEVRYIPEKHEYWAMYAAFPRKENEGCLSDDLFFATSPDGIRWQTYPVPILDHLDGRFRFLSLYRASFAYEAATDRIRTIVSAKDTVWGLFGVVHDYRAMRGALDASLTLSPASFASSPNLVRRPETSRRRLLMNARP